MTSFMDLSCFEGEAKFVFPSAEAMELSTREAIVRSIDVAVRITVTMAEIKMKGIATISQIRFVFFFIVFIIQHIISTVRN